LETSNSILKKYWGHNTFRPLQEEIINAIISKKDVLALLPTGGGKSICFQVPGMMMDGICLVITPLIALMKDQVENLKKRGINSLAIHTGMSFFEVKKTLQNAAYGNYKFLYLSPERLETKLFKEYLPAINVSLIAIDEAHCISQWGYDFRPSYLKIVNLREELPNIPIIALTASATAEVQKDISKQLLFSKNNEVFQQSFARPNLSYSVLEPESKQSKLIEILKQNEGTSIVYCKSRKQTQQITEWLLQNKINADFYHAGLSNEQRQFKQMQWIQNKIRTIVCTNAFGMGIDKPDVRTVVHYNLPESLENYYQEAGRAGRDEQKATAILFYEKKEKEALYNINELRYPNLKSLKKLYIDIMNYLQMPAGSGEGVSIDFDIAKFSEQFKLNILEVTYGLQALIQEGLFYISDATFKSSTVVFNVTKEDLKTFEETHSHLEPMIKSLLRNYEGIFDYPSNIYESLLVNQVGVSIEEVKNQLLELNKYSIIKYQQQANKSQLLLLQNRMYQDDFKFDVQQIEKRKKNHSQKIKAIIDYAELKQTCRAKTIANYFNDSSTEKCGVCDNCLASTSTGLNNKNFDEISKSILNILSLQICNISTIENSLHHISKEKIKRTIEYLLAEEKIYADESGMFIKNKGTEI